MKHGITALIVALNAFAAPGVAGANFALRDEAIAFAQDMQDKHGLDRATVLATLEHAEHQERVIRLITPPATPGTRSWQRYRSRFLDSARIEAGAAFWLEHHDALREASSRYGVPPEVIAAVIGVETYYGRHTGGFETVSALATLAFDYPPRAALFLHELENLFLLAHEQRRDPSSYVGSYAGAIGFPQFLPSSIRHYAVDFDGDGRIDFDTDPVDAIGSVANYLAQHGWIAGEPIAVPALIPPRLDVQPFIDAGIEPTLSPSQLADAGIVAASADPHAGSATLIDLATPGEPTEYWLGYRNFYVITRYNKSSFYAMAVFELSRALRDQFRLVVGKRAD